MRASRRFIKKRSVKAGLPPGSLIHIGEEPPAKASEVTMIAYTQDSVTEQNFNPLTDPLPHLGQPGIVWINIEGVNDTDIISKLGERYAFHPLALEDIVSTIQRPKVEDYGDYLFIVLRMLRAAPDGEFISEQLSIVLGPDYLFTFQEGIAGDVFDGVRNRIRNAKGKIRSMGSDYLAYALIDAIVDGYFGVLEDLGERVVNVEEELTVAPSRRTLVQINEMRKEIIYLRKSVWPLREVISFLERGDDSAILTDGSRVFFRDVYDHTIQVIDTVETYRDLLSGMLDLYLSSISNRTNEVMKFLTVIGTIFMPLTFLVGVYGMNFKNLPELGWHYGYHGLWVFMILLSLSMVLYFRKKKWL